MRWQPELSYNAALSRGWVLGAVEQLMLFILPVLLEGLVLGGWSRVWGLLFCVWESYLSFLIIDTCVKNMASGVSKVAAASGWEVCGAIPLFLTFACGVLHTKSMLESWRMWLDVVILPYSAASQRPFELDCPEVTQALFKVHLLPPVITLLSSWSSGEPQSLWSVICVIASYVALR